MYSIVYLPSVRGDIQSIIAYIADELKAPQSAINLLDVLESSISNLQEFPYAYPIYQPLKSMDNEYRVLPVKNYLVFYIVKEAVEPHTTEVT